MNSTENTDEGTTENTEPWRIEWSDTQAQLHIEAEATAQKNPPAPGWRKLATIHGTSDDAHAFAQWWLERHPEELKRNQAANDYELD